jgi:pimeloyl-ACP methyl ester carboxylesterase
MTSLPPVVLIHGFASSFEHGWTRQGWPDLLADEGRTVVAVEMLGHGASARPHDFAAYEELEAHALAQIPDEPVDAVGFSAGAMTLLRLAIDHPSRFRRIVLMGIGDTIFEGGEPTKIVEALEAPDGPPVDDILGVSFRRLADSESNDRAALIAFLRRPSHPFEISRLAQVSAAALVIVGDRDNSYPATRLHEALPDAELLVIHGLDHFSTPADYRAMEAALAFVAT